MSKYPKLELDKPSLKNIYKLINNNLHQKTN